MKNKIINKPRYSLMLFILICLVSCYEEPQKDEDCSKFINENYIEETIDTILLREAFETQSFLIEIFGENSLEGVKHEAYHMQFYSSHGYGKSVKFEKKIGGCSLSVKCKTRKDWFPDCKEYKIGIGIEEWDKLEKMIYEFNFWTEENFRGREGVLDGAVFFLEGNRPEAEKCSKKTYKIVGRGSPRYDKMGALCDYILEYEDQLAFRYEQREIK